MNIHEYQAKKILKKMGAPVPNGVEILNLNEIKEKIKNLNSKNLVLKAQIHAGGRGKAGGIKLINNIDDLIIEAKKMFGKILFTHQTGASGRKVKRLYIEEVHKIKKELDKMLLREGRHRIAKACFEFIKYKTDLDLLGWNDNNDIFKH